MIDARLTERQREIVDLYFFKGLTQQEIAKELKIPQQVVSKHLFGVIRCGKRVGGGMQKLRKACEKMGISPNDWVER